MWHIDRLSALSIAFLNFSPPFFSGFSCVGRGIRSYTATARLRIDLLALAARWCSRSKRFFLVLRVSCLFYAVLSCSRVQVSKLIVLCMEIDMDDETRVSIKCILSLFLRITSTLAHHEILRFIYAYDDTQKQ